MRPFSPLTSTAHSVYSAAPFLRIDRLGIVWFVPNFVLCIADWCIRLFQSRRSNGFATAFHLTGHFGDHASDFGATTEQEYEILADRFMVGCLRRNVRECVRASNGDRLRLDVVTNEFGVISAGNVIRTYYIPNPSIHGKATNLIYFSLECLK